MFAPGICIRMGAQMVAVVVIATVPLPRTSFRIAAIRKGRSRIGILVLARPFAMTSPSALDLD